MSCGRDRVGVSQAAVNPPTPTTSKGILVKVIYIAGPFRGPSSWDVQQNIMRAMALALEVWRRDAVALCPHSNTMFFDGAAPDHVWLEGDLELLKRCDAVLLTDDWERSTGARAEVKFAVSLGIPVFTSIDQLDVFLKGTAA
jgi:nucleoside 2-deoxyribosyltransferase